MTASAVFSLLSAVCCLLSAVCCCPQAPRRRLLCKHTAAPCHRVHVLRASTQPRWLRAPAGLPGPTQRRGTSSFVRARRHPVLLNTPRPETSAERPRSPRTPYDSRVRTTRLRKDSGKCSVLATSHSNRADPRASWNWFATETQLCRLHCAIVNHLHNRRSYILTARFVSDPGP
jgi:hypothetical protein